MGASMLNTATKTATSIAMIDIILNGQARTVPENCSVQQLLETLDLRHKRIAVEVNGCIVPRGLHANTLLSPGAQLEIVGAVGGG
jgi:sulfur carrier protein